jgi:fatty acid elongase 3
MDVLVSLVEQHNDLLLSYTIPAVAIAAYLTTIVVLKLWMATRDKPFKVQSISAAHNFFLCVLSLAMAVGASYEAFVVRAPQMGLGELFCSTDRQAVFNNRLWFWCVVFYISKYYEFFDTVILLLRKRPLLVLHVWHHCSVSVLSLIFLRANMTFFFTGVIINGAIHTFTYYFYFQSSLGNTVWWKKYLTQAQMVQFLWGIASWLPWPVLCPQTRTTETDYVIGANFLILASFFGLFLNFFNHTYKGSSKPGSAGARDRKQKKVE